VLFCFWDLSRLRWASRFHSSCNFHSSLLFPKSNCGACLLLVLLMNKTKYQLARKDYAFEPQHFIVVLSLLVFWKSRTLPMSYVHIITVDFLLSCFRNHMICSAVLFLSEHNMFLIILKTADTQVISDYNLTCFFSDFWDLSKDRLVDLMLCFCMPSFCPCLIIASLLEGWNSLFYMTTSLMLIFCFFHGSQKSHFLIRSSLSHITY
jgi:hypothetical protein